MTRRGRQPFCLLLIFNFWIYPYCGIFLFCIMMVIVIIIIIIIIIIIPFISIILSFY